jgi:TolA-binding protein
MVWPIPAIIHLRLDERNRETVMIDRKIRVRHALMHRVAAIAALAAMGMAAQPAAAQDDEARIRKLEAEVRALQRQVFPGGDGKFFTPEIAAQPTPAPTGVNGPATSVTTGLLTRIEALEGQIMQLTAQSEENANALAVLTRRMDAMQSAGVAVPGAVNTGVPSTAISGTVPAANPPASRPVASNNAATAPNAGVTPTPTPAPAATAPSPQRVAAVQAVMKPATGDAGDDEYTYGFRLWDAGFYPEAAQQLRSFVDAYPNHWRTTYGRNLLGRAYLDNNQPREAAPWFLQNYQADKQGARAGDSLLYLAEAMIAINDTDRACIALAEFGDNYAALAAGRLRDQYEANRRKVTCNS